MEFTLEGVDFNETTGTAPHTPTFDSGTVKLVDNMKIFKDGVEIKVNNVTVNLEQPNGFITNTAQGRVSSLKKPRNVSLTIDPYHDSTSTDNFTDFSNTTAFNLFFYHAEESATAGELQLGSIVGFYFPNCIITSIADGDIDEVLTETIEISADGGASGNTNEIYMGLI